MFIFNLSRRNKNLLMMMADIVFVPVSLWLAFTLRISEWFIPINNQIWLFITSTLLAFPIFIKYELYRSVVRYIGYRAMLAIVKATGLLVLIWFLVAAFIFPSILGIEFTFPRYVVSESMFPRSIPILFWMFLVLIVGGSRQIIRWIVFEPTSSKAKRNALIYGAGRSGLELATALSHNTELNVLGFIDDDLTLKNHFIQNLKVLGDRKEISVIRSKVNSLEVFLAIPKIPLNKRKELLKFLEDKKVIVRTIPSLNDIASRVVNIDDIRDIDITDLLEREVIAPNHNLLATCIKDKNILVTGAGGSIGSELCRQIIPLKPKRIVLLEHSEHNLYTINIELKNLKQKTKGTFEITPVLGSITNEHRIKKVIRDFKINTIYHAAAYKHVNLIEINVNEGIQNNIFGTYNVSKAALDLSVENFILISTDKAVRPTSVMGATKRICELIVQGLSQKQRSEKDSQKKETRFAIVRFGNVLGSSGSVIPLFQKQIAIGGPITITHPEVSRYFMTISEASQLVMQAGSMSEHCDVFTLNMGEPVSILSLAKQLVYLSGHLLKTTENQTNNLAIEIQYTGLQKGEKIHEELFLGENITKTEHPMIMKAQENLCSWETVNKIISELESHINLDEEHLQKLLLKYATSSN